MSTEPTISRSNRISMYSYAGIGAIAAVAVAAQTIARLVAVAPGHDLEVTVPLRQNAQLPLGPHGAPVEALVQQAVVTVANPTPATLFALRAQPIVVGASLIAGILLAALFCMRMARGHAFKKGTALFAYLGAIVLGAGWTLSALFGQMSANGAISAISDHSYDIELFETNWMVAFGALALGAVGVALQVGERLHRDTEGLV